MSEKLGEFGLINKIRKLFTELNETCGVGSGFGQVEGSGYGRIEGIGDDCAVIPISDTESLVVTTDMLVEDVHFLRHGITPFLLGRKSLAVNLSDVAAMGAQPFCSFLSVSLTAATTDEWIEEFMQGFHDMSTCHGTALLGGDTTSSPGGIVINVTAMGRVKNDNIKRRSAAKEGDKIFVSGHLGNSHKGLLDIMAGNNDTSCARIHNDPVPQVAEGVWLGSQPEVHAMMDLSDGLASDLLHILRESGVSAKVTVENIPHNTTVEQAVTGGEDYKLLFTVESSQAQAVATGFMQIFGYEPFEIGAVIAGEPKITWVENGNIITPSWRGYTHF